jgi:hypothetical protein
LLGVTVNPNFIFQFGFTKFYATIFHIKLAGVYKEPEAVRVFYGQQNISVNAFGADFVDLKTLHTGALHFFNVGAGK